MPWTSEQLPWTFQYTPPARPEGVFEPLNWLTGPPILAGSGAMGSLSGPPVVAQGASTPRSGGPPVMLGGRTSKSPGGAPVMLGTGGRPNTYSAPSIMVGSSVHMSEAPAMLVGAKRP